MYVCLCSAVTDSEIHEAVESGAASLTDLQSVLPVGMCCGRCAETARDIVDELIRSRLRPPQAADVIAGSDGGGSAA